MFNCNGLEGTSGDSILTLETAHTTYRHIVKQARRLHAHLLGEKGQLFSAASCLRSMLAWSPPSNCEDQI